MTPRLAKLIRDRENDILGQWIALQTASAETRRDLMSESELRQQSSDFLSALRRALDSDPQIEFGNTVWADVRSLLAQISESRARQGFSPSETAMFVFSLKQPLFAAVQAGAKDAASLAQDTWTITTVIDRLGLYTTEAHQKSRESVIMRQQQEMMELSTPVVTMWEGILALPLIGTLDSARTQVVMENLLQRIVETGSSIAILDITGVPTVDTLVAQHLLKTVAAARLMGADCIISGIRPQIAQTIVHLGVDLNSVTTKATLADAFGTALRRLGLGIAKQPQPAA
ncbi:MAG TPA: STAS domain-containing protein [Vicinamibacterales bacterium]|nr:STAS domain-containing protein [Vicinamibacterales bacterium]